MATKRKDLCTDQPTNQHGHKEKRHAPTNQPTNMATKRKDSLPTNQPTNQHSHKEKRLMHRPTNQPTWPQRGKTNAPTNQHNHK